MQLNTQVTMRALSINGDSVLIVNRVLRSERSVRQLGGEITRIAKGMRNRIEKARIAGHITPQEAYTLNVGVHHFLALKSDLDSLSMETLTDYEKRLNGLIRSFSRFRRGRMVA